MLILFRQDRGLQEGRTRVGSVIDALANFSGCVEFSKIFVETIRFFQQNFGLSIQKLLFAEKKSENHG